MASEYKGTIIGIRAIEDSIRASKKYTEGIATMRKQHPIQGDEFPSKVFCKYYEVYPELKEPISWDMSARTAYNGLLWGEAKRVDIVFYYDYRDNKASIKVKEGALAIRELERYIPNFNRELSKVINNGNGHIFL